MEGVFMLIFLSITMLIGSFISGIIPLTLTLSESKMKHITILGAGLLIGTALAVIIPEGIHTLYSNANNGVHNKGEISDHGHSRNIGKRSAALEPNSDEYLIELFHNQLSANNRTNKLIKRLVMNHNDHHKMKIFLNQLSETININRVSRSSNQNEINLLISRLNKNNGNKRLVESLGMTSEDYKKIDLFLNQISANMRQNKIINKRSLDKQEIEEINLFLSHINVNNKTTTLIKRLILTDGDRVKLDLFLNQLSSQMNLPKVLRSLDQEHESDQYLIELFHNRISSNNQITKLVKRSQLNKEDFEKLQVFLNRLSAHMNVNKLIEKRKLNMETNKIDTNKETDTFYVNMIHNQLKSKTHEISIDDNDKLELLIDRLSSNVDKVARHVETDQYLMELFLNRVSAGNHNTKLIKRVVLNKDDYNKINLFLNQISAHMNMPKVLNRGRRAASDTIVEKKSESVIKTEENSKENPKKFEETSEHEHHEHKESGPAHSSIGVTLVLGFVFMLIVDQIGGKISHRPHQDTQALRNKITFTTTLGLVVHSAADGIALGAAAATSRTDVEMIVFIAIMLHKAPAAFGLVSFLIHEGLERARVRKHLTIFAMAAPIMAIITFTILKSQSSLNLVTSDSTGLCMLFSAGTFLYVSTVHVLPEVQSHNEDRGFKFSETLSFIAGSMIPLILSIGHSH